MKETPQWYQDGQEKPLSESLGVEGQDWMGGESGQGDERQQNKTATLLRTDSMSLKCQLTNYACTWTSSGGIMVSWAKLMKASMTCFRCWRKPPPATNPPIRASPDWRRDLSEGGVFVASAPSTVPDIK